MITEDQLEQICLDWFRTGGYEYAYGPDIAHDGDMPERRDYQQTILTSRLINALQKINPHIPFVTLEEAALAITKPQSPVLIHNNRAFHKLLLEGVPVEYRDGDDTKSDHVQLIDFHNIEKNQFLVVNQFTVQGGKQLRRPDIVVFINGIPIAVIELKNPADINADVWKAYDQLQTYKDEIPDLFACNEALVVSDGLTARIGSLTANKERFLPWRTIRSEEDKPLLEYELEKVVKGFFDRELLLDYLRYFILFEQEDGNVIKKIAGYHQFHAVREAVRVTLIASAPIESERVAEWHTTYGKEVQPGSRKAGVVWHTQGSGKSITMCCYAGKLLQQPEMNNPTIVVVTDRNDLDGQLFATFCNAQELLRQTPVQVDSREELRKELAARQSGGIIFTTVQKFSLLNGEEEHPSLSTRSNIVVISDEAHRSQYGFKAKLDTKTGAYIYGYAKHMRDAIPNASFIGFTGTPISTEDKDTQAVFGGYVSIYDIQDAVDDGATVPIYYESRLAKLDINRAEIEELNNDVEEVIEDEEDVTLRERTKSKWATLEKLVGAEPRLEEVAEDLVRHFDARTAVVDGKGMIVCMSREICVHLYNEIVKIRPEWHDADPEKGAIKIVMTGSAADRLLLQPHIYNKQTKKRLEKRFKDAKDDLRLVIVRDMWLTGFDCPSCHTMYVDKPMRDHNLMQAIARVNRVFKDKPGGLVVDYIGIANELKQALKVYVNAQGKGAPTLQAEEAFAVLLEKLDVVRGLFHGFDYSDYATRAHQILILAANHLLGIKDGKKRFLDAMAAITRAFSLCGTLDEAEPLRKEIAFFAAIRAAIVKHTTVDTKLTEEQKNSALKQILDNAVIAEGVADVFALAGLDKPNIALLSDEFLDDVRNMKSRNLALELLEKLLRDTIKARTRNNLVLEQKFSERLLATLNRYHARAIEAAQVIELMIQMAKDFLQALKRDEELGLNPDEVAFYDALANNESAVRELGDAILKKIAVEITAKLRESTSVDWQVRESVRAKLRNLVRRTLRKWKYPPDKQDAAVELVLKQAEVACAGWKAFVSDATTMGTSASEMLQKQVASERETSSRGVFISKVENTDAFNKLFDISPEFSLGYVTPSHVEFEKYIPDEVVKQHARKESLRYIQHRFFQQNGDSYVEEKRRLEVGIPVKLNVRIGPPDDSWQAAPDVFPDHLLPKRRKTNLLQVVFYEPDQLDQPLTNELSLPRKGASNEVEFSFAPRLAAPFNGRITVLHRGRVLQTALVQTEVCEPGAPVDETPGISQKIETLVRNSLSGLNSRREFDLAFVMNHTAGERPMLTGISSKRAWARDLTGINDPVDKINVELSKVATSVADFNKGLFTKESEALFVRLARIGANLYSKLVIDDLMATQTEDLDLEKALYIQIVSTRPDAVVPLEFVYQYEIPKSGAKICPNAVEALKNVACPALCKRVEQPRDYVCPLGFWGLSKVIERHVYNPKLVLPDQATLMVQSEPLEHRDRLDLEQGAVLGYSKEVEDKQVATLVNILRECYTDKVLVADDWEKWRTAVKEYHPTLQVAFPHNDGSEEDIQLEINNDFLETLRLPTEQDFVHVKGTAYPLVMLLGCDVAGTAQQYASHVGRFRQAGAAVVISTIATVFGEHAVSVGEKFVSHLLDPARPKGKRLGELLRDVKREAVAESLPMALCVVAFGDADWRL